MRERIEREKNLANEKDVWTHRQTAGMKAETISSKNINLMGIFVLLLTHASNIYIFAALLCFESFAIFQL